MKLLKLFNEQSEYALISENLENGNFLTVSYIEENDIVKYNPKNYADEYLTFENVSGPKWDSLKFYIPKDVPTTAIKSISYSIDDGSTWTKVLNIDNEDVIVTIDEAPNNKVLFKGNNDTYTYYHEDWDEHIQCSFSSEQLFDVYGNIMSLFYGDNFKNKNVFPQNSKDWNCYSLFSWGYYNEDLDDNPPVCNIRNAKNLILPVIELTSDCYNSMFNGCSSLITAPELPATTLTDYCYQSMFSGCRLLTEAPELPATSLFNSCYQYMFRDCTALVEAPELPATTLAEGCYYGMFRGCSSLTEAPELPATTLTDYCYQYMFYNCTSLIYIKMMAKNISDPITFTNNWVYNVSHTGTFIQNSEANWYFLGNNGIPVDWVISYEGDSSIAKNEKHRLISNMLTFKALESGTFTFTIPSDANNYFRFLSYSIDDGSTWTTIYKPNTSSAITITTPTIPSNGTVIWQGDAGSFTNSSGSAASVFNATGNFEIYGNISSILYNGLYEYRSNNGYSGYNYIFRRMFYYNTKLISAENLILPNKVRSQGKYWEMFYGCSNLLKAPAILPSTVIDNYECYGMFQNCSSLTTAPELPAVNLTNTCYKYMFYGCSSLTTAPELPATTLSNNCYDSMFYGCSSLIEAPELSVTSLSNSCYQYMFRGCSSLTEAPELPATTLTSSCYAGMFRGCSSLTEAPELSATTLANSCYYDMFRECTSLTKAPELPATTLQQGCYYSMFRDCSSLIEAPKLSATTLVNSPVQAAGGCCGYMFANCSSLTEAPELPATTLTTWCYTGMFQGCTSLTKAPELPAATLASWCYNSMFHGCSKLNYIKALFTTSPGENTSAIGSWVYGVASTGTFVKNIYATWTATGQSGVPNGWTISTGAEEIEEIVDTYTSEYFTLEARENNTSFTLSIPAAITTDNLTSISYSLDNGSTWTTTNNSSSAVTITTPDVSKGDKVLWKGSGTNISKASNSSKFTATGKFNVEGNIMSLLYDDNFEDKTSMTAQQGFNSLFMSNNKIVSARKLVLPVKNPPAGCYINMFKGSSLVYAPAVIDVTSPTGAQPCLGMFQNCASLISAPSLPATSINVMGVYQVMFEGCSSLQNAPYLPAATIGNAGYQTIFRYCTKLVNVQKILPVTTMTGNRACYGMFYGCTSLEVASELPALTLVSECYGWMFGNCSKLRYIKAMFTTTPSNTYTQGWVTAVPTTSDRIFVKNAAAQWDVRGTNGIPTNWTVQTATE